ncbi:MAG: Flp pilus assembly protein CpaB [bacterium]|nr:Flp pilus assembly protein CpaB [bacterium]
MLKQPGRPKSIGKSGPFTILSRIFLVLVVIVPLSALAYRYQSKDRDKAIAEATTKHILLPVPTDGIARGELLGDATYTMISWPVNQLTGRYIQDLSLYPEARSRSQLPRLLPIPITAVTTKEEDTNAVTERIPRGMRAITVRVDAESAVEGWARSGSYVDVIVIQPSSLAADGLEAKVIAENVRILSANRQVEEHSADGTESPATVTLLVNQENALRIKTAQTVGRLTFALRGLEDELPTSATNYDAELISGRKPVERSYLKGTARGPDGREYFLDESNVWTRK